MTLTTLKTLKTLFDVIAVLITNINKLEMNLSEEAVKAIAQSDLEFLEKLEVQQMTVQGHVSADLELQRRLVNEFIYDRQPVTIACLVCSNVDRKYWQYHGAEVRRL
jgi:hypothetical protein